MNTTSTFAKRYGETREGERREGEREGGGGGGEEGRREMSISQLHQCFQLNSIFTRVVQFANFAYLFRSTCVTYPQFPKYLPSEAFLLFPIILCTNSV